MNKFIASSIKTQLRQVLASFLITVLVLVGALLAYPGNQAQAKAAPLTQKLVAYNIDREIDQERKEFVKQQHGSDVEKIVEEAQQNNENKKGYNEEFNSQEASINTSQDLPEKYQSSNPVKTEPAFDFLRPKK